MNRARRRGERGDEDPARLEVFHHLFASVAEEMGAALMRSAFSPNIQERRDFSCALFDAEGRTISQAAHIPIHLGSVPLCVEAARRDVAMGPGDAVILNDPYRGGTHLPDVTLVTPVFIGGARKPAFYCANRAHHADIGGAHPGSMAPVPDIHAEGLRIPPQKLVRAGVPQRELLALLLANMRVPREREGDLLAQWSANRLGARRLEELAREHGARELARRAAELMGWTERLMRAALRELPQGSVRFEDRLEGPHTLRVELVLEGGRHLTVDLTRCDDQTDAPINTPRAVALSAVFYVLRLLLPPGTPTNDGVLRPVRLLTRPGSLVDARYPAPVAAGNVETSQRLVDLLLGALAQLVPEKVPAASAGTMSNLSFGGRDLAGAEYTYYETLAGGAGASPQGAGAHAVHTHMTNTRNTPIEALETLYPVRVLALAIRRGSGGVGRHAGGDGQRKHLRFLAPARVGWIADRATRGPFGLAGGSDGAPGRARLRRPGGEGTRELPSRTALEVEAGSELELETPGGGGYGTPR
jgi:N-methylhydantoinase B